jgi:hypothetical protein
VFVVLFLFFSFVFFFLLFFAFFLSSLFLTSLWAQLLDLISNLRGWRLMVRFPSNHLLLFSLYIDCGESSCEEEREGQAETDSREEDAAKDRGTAK